MFPENYLGTPEQEQELHHIPEVFTVYPLTHPASSFCKNRLQACLGYLGYLFYGSLGSTHDSESKISWFTLSSLPWERSRHVKGQIIIWVW